MTAQMMTTREMAAEIRKRIRAVAPTVSVRMGRGTARSWIDLEGSGEYGRFTDAERAGLARLGLRVGLGNSYPIRPEEKRALIEGRVARPDVVW